MAGRRCPGLSLTQYNAGSEFIKGILHISHLGIHIFRTIMIEMIRYPLKQVELAALFQQG